MARLPRRHIPMRVRVEVAERQILAQRQADPDFLRIMRTWVLKERLTWLLQRLFPDGEAHHLDHNPALALRAQIKRKGIIIGYVPAEHDPQHLIYRSAAEHKIKTLVRGDGAQHPDRVLITREKRRARPLKPKRRTKWPKGRKIESRGFQRRGKKCVSGGRASR